MATNLVELNEVMTHLRIVDPDEKYHEELNLLIVNCSGLILEKISRDIFIQNYANEYHSIDRETNSIFTNQYPISSITSITENDTALTVDTQYKTDNNKGQIFRVSSTNDVYFKTGKNIIAITYRAGYIPPDIPKNLKQACLELIWFKFTNRDGGSVEEITFGSKGQGTSVRRTKMIQGLPENVFYLIQPSMDVRVK